MFLRRCISVTILATLALSEQAERWNYEGIGSAYMEQMERDRETQFNDYRLIRFKTIEENLVQYAHKDISNFVRFEMDMDNNQLIVGSREHIYRLSLHDLSLLEMHPWPGSDENRRRCENSDWKYCGNYVSIVKRRGGDVLICGTNNLNVTCDYRDPTNLTAVSSSVPADGLSPYRPEQMTTVLVTSDQMLFSASLLDKYSTYGVMVRYATATHEESLLSGIRDTYWFNSPSFVGSMEIGEHVYVFFRETSVECSGCGERIVSRIARVCKNETGRNRRNKHNTFATFAKARLNCSLPGDVPFYFDQIQSVYLEREEQLIYATFMAPPMLGSAICVYNMSSIQKTFHGSYKYRKDIGCNWFKVDSKYNKSCHNPPPSNFEEIQDAGNYLQMLDEVQPTLVGPLVMCDLDRWNHIEVHRVATVTGGRTVIYVSSTRGYIKKFMVHPSGDSACLVEFIRLLRSGQREPVLEMMHSVSQNALYVALEGRILKIPNSRCDRFSSKTACQSAQDPYCGWDTGSSTCTKKTEGREQTWEQSITQCPVLDYPVDGKWARWSDWVICPYVKKDTAMQFCYCRSRECNQPRRSFNGLDCEGSRSQLSNCTFTEGWSDWGKWSNCPPTCDFGMRVRSRTCLNTPEVLGGKPCPGLHFEEQSCEEACWADTERASTNKACQLRQSIDVDRLTAPVVFMNLFSFVSKLACHINLCSVDMMKLLSLFMMIF